MPSRRIACIDLTARTVVKEEIPIHWQRKYLGGRGLNAYLLYSLLDPQADPLGPDNPLLVGAGFLNGVPGLGPARLDITAISPQSGNLGNSNIGGHFGPELRFAGFDHLVITGRSPTPVYIMVRDGDIQIRDARHLWGKDTWETQQAIKKDNGSERVRALVIGPAGERLVRLACVMTGPKDAAGRYGMGAVMGAKNLKAIAAWGTGDIAVANPEGLLAYAKGLYDEMVQSKWMKQLRKFGTPLLAEMHSEAGWLYTRDGWGPPLGQKGRALYAQNINEQYSLGMASCFGCFAHCRYRYLMKEGRYAGVRDEGPEFVPILTFGYCNENVNLESLMYINHLCNRMGLDLSTTGQMVRFAMHLYQHGIITKSDLGRELPWGDVEGTIALIEDIANRRGFGHILAEGSYALKSLPPEAATYLPLFKNALPLVTFQRVAMAVTLAQVVSTIPGHQHRCESPLDFGLPGDVLRQVYGGDISSDPQSYDGKARMIWFHQLLHAIADSLGYCRFLHLWFSPRAPKFEEYCQLLKMAEGLDISVAELKEIGERIYTTERLILGKFGLGSRQFDTLPAIYFRPAVGGKYPGSRVDPEKLQKFLDEQYEFHGWNRDGIPTPELIERLGIDRARLPVKTK